MSVVMLLMASADRPHLCKLQNIIRMTEWSLWISNGFVVVKKIHLMGFSLTCDLINPCYKCILQTGGLPEENIDNLL